MFWLTADGCRNIGRNQKATPPGLRPHAPVQQPCRLFERTNIRQGRMVVTLGCGNRGPAAPIGTPAHWTSKTVPRCQHPQRRQQRTNHYSHAIHGRFDATASQTFNSSSYKAAPDLEPGHRSPSNGLLAVFQRRAGPNRPHSILSAEDRPSERQGGGVSLRPPKAIQLRQRADEQAVAGHRRGGHAHLV